MTKITDKEIYHQPFKYMTKITDDFIEEFQHLNTL